MWTIDQPIEQRHHSKRGGPDVLVFAFACLCIPADQAIHPSEEVLRLDTLKVSCDSAVFVPMLTADISGFQTTSGANGLSILPFPTFNESIKPNIPLFLFRRSESRDRPENARARVLLDVFSHKLSKRHNTFFGDVLIFWRKSVDEIKHQMKLSDFTLQEYRKLTHSVPPLPQPQNENADQRNRKDSIGIPGSTASTSSESSGNQGPTTTSGQQGKWQRSGPDSEGVRTSCGNDATDGQQKSDADGRGEGRQSINDLLARRGGTTAPDTDPDWTDRTGNEAPEPHDVHLSRQQETHGAPGIRASLTVLSNFLAMTSRVTAESAAVAASIEDLRSMSQEIDTCLVLKRENKILQDEVTGLRRDLENTSASLQRMTDEVALRQSEIFALRKQNEEATLALRCLEQRLVDERSKYSEALPLSSPAQATANIDHFPPLQAAAPAKPSQERADGAKQKGGVQQRRPSKFVVLQTYSPDAGADTQFASLKVGDAVKVERQDESGWWWVVRERDGQVALKGWFPSSFLRPMNEA